MIHIVELNESPISLFSIEKVERKGLGHPDTLSDGIAEGVSRALSRTYLKKFGTILHHNTDQVEIVGGNSKPVWGGGEITKPITVFLSGRATASYNGQEIDVEKIAINAAKSFLKEKLKNLPQEKVEYICKIKEGSQDLQETFNKECTVANDTSFGMGFAPLTELESLVKQSELYLNSSKIKKKYPSVGEDIKVMGLKSDDITLTLAIAFVSKYLKNNKEYIAVKEELKKEITEFAKSITSLPVSIYINTLDDHESTTPSSYFLTVSGTSAESGDDGSVGRGNRASGLITPCRPMSMEAAAGKNPIAHVGKLYNILGFKTANRIVDELNVKEAYVQFLSQIGKPINQPLAATIYLVGGSHEAKINRIVQEELNALPEITKKLTEGKVELF